MRSGLALVAAELRLLCTRLRAYVFVCAWGACAVLWLLSEACTAAFAARRVEAFGTKVILTAVAGAITALVVAQAFIELAANWYQCGRTEARNARSTAIKHLQV